MRRLIFRQVHQRLGGEFRLVVSAGAFLPPALQQAWEDIGVTVLQGYGATETGTGSSTRLHDHGLGTVGWPPDGIEILRKFDAICLGAVGWPAEVPDSISLHGLLLPAL